MSKVKLQNTRTTHFFNVTNMSEKQKPLYCFKVVDDKFTLEKLEITDYVKSKFSSYSPRWSYSWGAPNIIKGQTGYSISSDKLDRYVNEKVFTFDDDINRVYEIIYRQISKDLDIYEKRYTKARNNLKSLISSHSQNLGGLYENNQ